jgi:hypothetical protein
MLASPLHRGDEALYSRAGCLQSAPVRCAAHSPPPLLVRGEPGRGRRGMAHQVHSGSAGTLPRPGVTARDIDCYYGSLEAITGAVQPF